ncbi:MAG: type II toxin-antitoxin system RelE/ParE family toxin [Rhodospirillales bacterium]|nr:type II toxin-antitoxin system RelE/ParE family toxin [Rhodospirillales bacterium]
MRRLKATRTYLKRAKRLLDAAALDALHDFVAANPEAGDIVAGTGGVRKLRWGLAGQGKRGGVRVIHLYLGHRETIWLLDIYAKREQADLSPDDVKAIRRVVAAIKDEESPT